MSINETKRNYRTLHIQKINKHSRESLRRTRMVSNTTILLQFISFILVGAEAAPTNEVNINTGNSSFYYSLIFD